MGRKGFHLPGTGFVSKEAAGLCCAMAMANQPGALEPWQSTKVVITGHWLSKHLLLSSSGLL